MTKLHAVLAFDRQFDDWNTYILTVIVDQDGRVSVVSETELAGSSITKVAEQANRIIAAVKRQGGLPRNAPVKRVLRQFGKTTEWS